jgi:hypothetical protein
MWSTLLDYYSKTEVWWRTKWWTKLSRSIAVWTEISC